MEDIIVVFWDERISVVSSWEKRDLEQERGGGKEGEGKRVGRGGQRYGGRWVGK